MTRKLPPYEVLGEEGLATIEDNAETILEETGIDFCDDAEALAIWKDAGAIDGQRVRFPRGLCRSLIQRSAPAEFVQHARNPARSVRIGGPHAVFGRADMGYDFRFFAEEFGLVGECDERDVTEIDALLRSHAAKEVSVVEA
jgi:trimethylamine:corrinoid methyltransferase-like protein